MRIPTALKLFTFGSFLLILASVVSAFAAGISVPSSIVGQQSVSVTAEDIKPSDCDALYLTNIVSGSGTLTGTAANDLIIGSAGADSIDGLGGDDCVLGGGGDDSLLGNDGNDVCLGGPGSDIFTDCEVEAQ
jgi:Hemolysin-type calcium-binding repeat (2 copies).